MNGPAQLRARLAEPGIVMAPGAYDAVSARLVERAGFPAVYMTGFGHSASHLGLPDAGFISLPEMVERVSHMVRAVGVPVIADADTGCGNALNVRRTVELCEAAGAAGIRRSPRRPAPWSGRCAGCASAAPRCRCTAT